MKKKRLGHPISPKAVPKDNTTPRVKKETAQHKEAGSQPASPVIDYSNYIGMKTRPIGIFKIGSAKDVQFAAIKERRGVAERYGEKGFFEKYGQLLGNVFLGLLLAFVVIYTLNKFITITDTLAQAIKGIQAASENFGVMGKAILEAQREAASGSGEVILGKPT